MYKRDVRVAPASITINGGKPTLFYDDNRKNTNIPSPQTRIPLIGSGVVNSQHSSGAIHQQKRTLWIFSSVHQQTIHILLTCQSNVEILKAS